MKYLVLIVFTLLVSVQSCSALRIPKTIQGTWDANDEACKTKYSDSRLVISAVKIEYWESSGKLIDVIKSKNNAFIARFAFSGEGESWENEVTYNLLNEGNTLVQTFEDGKQVSRHRCSNMQR